MDSFKPRLFYSYSHKDKAFREELEHRLSLLKSNQLLTDWSDRQILPGQSIGEKTRQEIDSADIIAFLLSPDFIASKPCRDEWDRAVQNAGDRPRFRVPIVVRPCAWKDLLEDDDIKALPVDGKPISTYRDADSAWQEVYDGIKSVLQRLRSTFTPKASFLETMECMDFVSLNEFSLSKMFVFLTLSRINAQDDANASVVEDRITNFDSLISHGNCLLHGPDMSGRTALARYIYLTLLNRNQRALIIDFKDSHGRYDRVIRNAYSEQFNGDFTLWVREPQRTLIIDNLSSSPAQMDLIMHAVQNFDCVIATSSSDTYYSYFRDEKRLNSFEKFRIEPLTRVQQERLIRSRIDLMSSVAKTDGAVDDFEKRVNAVIGKGIVPRYPFYVLSILQTFEAFMPSNLSITSYGHCYYVLILASLIKAGIADRDEDINVCINFAEHLAFRIFQSPEFGKSEFEEFLRGYRKEYLLQDAILNRLMRSDHGILNAEGKFRVPYMQHFFLGAYLAKPITERKQIVESLCNRSSITDNHLTLLFVIHHAVDDDVIDHIVNMTTRLFSKTQPAILDRTETGRFSDVVKALPDHVLSGESVETERRREREMLDSNTNDDDDDDLAVVEEANDWYRTLRNMDILAHVLRVRYGKLTKRKLGDIVETVAEGGLRLVNSILKDEDEIRQLAEYLSTTVGPRANIDKVRRLVRLVSFIWTMVNVEKIVDAVGHRQLREIVAEVIARKGTPAYDIIGYFGLLDISSELTDETRDQLDSLLKRHDDPFVRYVLSIRTQIYMNTHKSKAKVEQKFCSLLGIPYRHRLRLGRPVDR